MPSPGPVVDPATTYECPLCQEMIGRKALAAHLRTCHDFERPAEMDFVPARDILPGRLTCAHCRATFSMDFALRIHFKKVSCPVRLCQLVRDLHFGAPIPVQIADMHEAPVTRRSTMTWSFDLMGPIEPLDPLRPASMSLLTPIVFAMRTPLSFAPEVRLQWFMEALIWVIHWPALPQVCLPMTWLSWFLQHIHLLLLVIWAWRSTEGTQRVFFREIMSERADDQLELLIEIFYFILSTRWPKDGDLIQMIARLSLRQEDLLNQMSLDRSFVVFLQCGKGSVMHQLLQSSKDWHNKRQTQGVNQPLRTSMFTTFIEELIRRAQSLKLDDPKDALLLGLRSKKILTSSNHWNYLSWDSKAECLLPNKMDPLNSTTLHEMLQTLARLSQRPDLVHRFTAMKPLPKDKGTDELTIAIPWRLDLSMGSQESHDMHRIVTQLSGNGITQLVLMRHRPTSLQRSPLAVAISQKLRK
ncbi:unnamed protein product [Durusdinium trenchii]|uniref:C2H2-type domain-containing protein n=1 Tax=Durusdinium trenchii TaxID=1381693 RepID=A0ABP0S8V9_9DINO